MLNEKIITKIFEYYHCEKEHLKNIKDEEDTEQWQINKTQGAMYAAKNILTEIFNINYNDKRF